MADKEERIFVFTTIKYTIKETNEDGVIVDRFIELRDKAKMYTRQGAINKIGVALCVADGAVDCKECIYRGTDNCKTQLKNWYLKDAGVALNALLEGVKK